MAAKKVMKLMFSNKEIIKPSSPTPSHLQTFKLSLMDTYAPAIRMPLIFFYRAGGGDINVGRRLKKFLSETLSRFYPVAGRLSADLHTINCHDEGVPYHQVRANMSMSEALERPEIDEIDRLIPNAPAMEGVALAPLLEVQATHFECGGLAIAISMSHKVGDGQSLHTFAKAWSRANFGNQDLVVPDFTASSELPAPDPFQFELPPAFIELENFVSRRFVIDASKVRDLKTIAASDAVPQPTRTEVVSALLWKCSLKATTAQSRSRMSGKPSVLTWTVNIRSRLFPPFSDSSMGNLVALLAFQHQGESTSLAGLVRKLREGINEFNLHYVKDQHQGGKEQRISPLLRSSSSYHNLLQQGYTDWKAHSSCCGLRFYDIDFGWGKTAWVSLPISALKNTTAFIDTPRGGGVEAFANLRKEKMDLLEHDPAFLEFASVNSSPL